MSLPSASPTAPETGLMRGFPPAPDARVSRDNQLIAPYNRWGFQHAQAINCSVDVWRGDGPVALLDHAVRDLDGFGYQTPFGPQTFGDMVAQSHTDGIIVLHRGAIIYERYRNGMQPQTRHVWASGSKSITGTLAAVLAHDGLLDPDALVTDTLPELRASGFAGATVRQVMDMTTALDWSDTYGYSSDARNHTVAMGLMTKPEGYTGPETIYEFLATIKQSGAHGRRFAYVTANTDALAWLIRRTLGMSLADAMQERLWSLLGAERDAYWLVDAIATESAGSGLNTTVRDMARFGQMMLQQGRFNSRQIVPVAVIADIERGADREAFARGPVAGPGNAGFSYHQQWWISHNARGAYFALGYGGQILCIDPAAQMVFAKFSSYPMPAPAGAEFLAAIFAMRALGEALRDELL